MIFIPIGNVHIEQQFDMLAWAKERVGGPSPTTWFWAKHTMEYDDHQDYRNLGNAIVFIRDDDAVAFKLAFEL